MKIKEKSLLKQSLIDEFEIFHFCKNIIDIIEPNFDCQIKEDKIIIRIELPGEVLDFKTRINFISGFYNINFKGKIAFPKMEYSGIKDGNMKDGEFRLDFKIPLSEGPILKSYPYIQFDPSNGIAVVTYEIAVDENPESGSDIEI